MWNKLRRLQSVFSLLERRAQEKGKRNALFRVSSTEQELLHQTRLREALKEHGTVLFSV